ncbi:CD209 antigen-like protein E [Peromyscus californicus insignis]|uniref:CD209 antigen-like protein E n=1 Tax=Peromyscus californicus insignis TaxID=564181 RepID=UPI0022A73289|nr:CD209 antigen-like protein E [Peromyscus californicus insignis]
MGLYKSQGRQEVERGSQDKQKMAGEPETQQPKNHEEEVTFGGQGFVENNPEGPSCSSKSMPECLTRVPWLLLLLMSLGLFVLMLAILVQVSRIHAYPQGQTPDQQGSSSLVAVPPEQTHSSLEQIQQQLTQINASLAGLCRPCPWDWELFQGSCYLFSRTLGSWEASASSCQDLGAHLVIINSVEEQRFMKYWNVRKNQRSWIGLSDLRREGSWQWVDGNPLQLSFWKEGEPNNDGDEDCVELFTDDWNDNKCTEQNFWVCEQPSAPCPRH